MTAGLGVFGRVALVATAMMAAVAASAGEASRDGAYARWDARELTVGNAKFSATFQMCGGVLKTVSFPADGRDSIPQPQVVREADALAGVRVPPVGGSQFIATGSAAADEIDVSEAAPGWSAAGEKELAVYVSSHGRTATVRVWPGAPGAMVEQAPAAPLPARPGVKDWGSKVFSFGWSRFAALGKCGDALEFAAPHLTVKAYTPLDRTDLIAELLDEREYEMPSCQMMEYLRCGVLDVRETLTGRGMVFVRLAPMPLSRTDPEAVDFVLNPATKSVMCVPNGYPLAMLAYGGGETGRLRALRDFQRSLWPYKAGRDGLLLSNTWGDGNKDSRINEEFLMKEVDSGADIGVEVVQIDDGWQKGRSVNSAQSGGKGVWNGYWAADPEFWTPDPVRFPRGLAPLAEAAKSKGMSIGLWFGPDSSDDSANWERDADCLLGFWRGYGMKHFKIDSVKLHTPEAFERNRRFFSKMLCESDGVMCFDLDCTAEVRPGFLGGMPVGPLFAENRYAHRKGDRRVYYPHQTLRALWSLAHVIDPVRLRMEFLNPAKKTEGYGDDPLRPAAWTADALFAIAMLSSPLAWMELSDVPEPVRAAWRPLIAKWKSERDSLQAAVAVPVGAKPDGVSWTGFVSVGEGGGYALVFRELNAKPEWKTALDGYFDDAELSSEVLAGRGSAAVENGELKVEIPETLGYLWVKLKGKRQ